MNKIEWSGEIKVGIAELDRQHKTAIDLFNNIDVTAEAKVMQINFDFLLEYLGVHFAYEEVLMKQSEYPESKKHKAEHDEMRKKISNLKELYSQGAEEVVCSLKPLLHLWVNDHKKNRDKNFGMYAKSKGIT